MSFDPPVIQPPAIYRTMSPSREISEKVYPVTESGVVARICLEWSATYHFAPPEIGKQFVGCSLRWPTLCKVVRIDREDVRVHERAHCAGWPADHPGGR
jgi:hypothetical protein